MFYVSETSKDFARSASLEVLIANASRVLPDKSAQNTDIQGVACPLMEFDWAPLISEGYRIARIAPHIPIDARRGRTAG